MDITTTILGVNMTGSSTQGIKTVLHPVSDLATAKAVYTALLGVPPQTDGSYYVGFEAAGQQIGLVPNGVFDSCKLVEHRFLAVVFGA